MGMPLHQSAVQRVLIVDDHPFFAAGLADALVTLHSGVCVETASSLDNALVRIDQRFPPDLILLDLGLPDRGGLALFEELQQRGLKPPVAIVSSRDDGEAVQAARVAGAQGFLSKSCDLSELGCLLQRLPRGGSFFPHDPPDDGSGPTLTPRQREVLALLVQGLPNKRICQQLGMSDHTVKTHLKSLYASLGVHNRTECAHLALSMGLVTQ